MVTPLEMWAEILQRYLEVERFDELVQVMLDTASPPMFLSYSDGNLGRIVPGAITQINEALATEAPAEIDRIRSELPWHLQEVDLATALLEVGTHSRYFDVPDSVYEHPPPTVVCCNASRHSSTASTMTAWSIALV